MYKILTFTTLLLTGLLIACGPGVPGHVSMQESKFDNSTQIRVEPAWVGYMTGLKLGLLWNSKMDRDKVVLDAVVQGIDSIASGESLHFRVDDKFYSLKSIDKTTQFEVTDGGVYPSIGVYIAPSGWSSKRYLVDTEIVDKMINGNNVIVKIDLLTKSIEAEFSIDAPTTAKPAFREFRQRMNNMNID